MSLGATLLRNDLRMVDDSMTVVAGLTNLNVEVKNLVLSYSNTLATVTFHLTTTMKLYSSSPISSKFPDNPVCLKHHFPKKYPKNSWKITDLRSMTTSVLRPELSTNALASLLSLTQLTNAVGQMMKTWATTNPWRKIAVESWLIHMGRNGLFFNPYLPV